MAKNTAQGSPDGPKYIFGKENVNYTGPKPASHEKIDSSPTGLRSELSGGELSDEERWDEFSDEMSERINNDLLEHPDAERFISFREGTHRRVDVDDISFDYAESMTEDGDFDASDYSIDFCFAAGGDFETAVNARSLGLIGTDRRIFPDHWDIDPDSATISVPLSEYLNDESARSHIDELKNSVEIASDSIILDDALSSDMFYEASREVVGDTDRRTYAIDMADNDAYDWEDEHDESEFDSFEEWGEARNEFVEDRIDMYLDVLSKDNIGDAFSTLVDEGEIYMENVDYNPYAKEFNARNEDVSKVVSRVFEDEGF